MTNFNIVFSTDCNDFCSIYNCPDDFPYRGRPARGIKLGDKYTVKQTFQMAFEVGGIQVADVIHNAMGYLMVSGRLKKLLKMHCNAEIEFLPFTLLNHKGRIAREDLVMANIVGTVDCVDLENTIGDPEEFYEKTFCEINKLELDLSKIKENLNLFRIASQPCTIIIREDLRGIFESEGITGIEYLELGSEVELLC